MNEYWKLRNRLLEAAKDYYILGDPSITDAEYDIHFRNLKKMEEELNVDDPITEKVRCGIVSNNSFDKMRHSPPMYSLDNAFDEEELISWKPKESNQEVIITPKLDGASLSLVYENGLLKYALRRGDGKEGDVITASALQINGVPTALTNSNASAIIRGEVNCPTFALEFAETYKNQRNFVSGSLNLKDPKTVKNRKLVFTAYKLIGTSSKTYEETLEILHSWGFTTVADLKKIKCTLKELNFQTILDGFKNLSIPTDGAVISLNNLEYLENLGYTSHHPRGMIAVKPKAEVKSTRLLDVQFQLGKTGIVTPVAILDPVILDDTTVTRCTLHNFQEIKTLDVAVNDLVQVMKSGFIIPKIIGVESRPVNRIPIKVTTCPSCDSKLTYDGAYLKCTNKECGDVTVQQLLRFTQSAGFKGFGKATIKKLVSAGISNIVSLLKCDYQFLERVLKSEKISVKLAEELLYRPSELLYTEALASINIPFINLATAENLLEAGFTDIFKLRSKDALMEVSGIGEIKAKKIAGYILDNHDMLVGLSKLLPLKAGAKDLVSKNVEMINITITGKVSISRSKAKKILQDRGFNLGSSITKKTDILLVGEKPGKDKIEKARKLGVSVVTYVDSEFASFL